MKTYQNRKHTTVVWHWHHRRVVDGFLQKSHNLLRRHRKTCYAATRCDPSFWPPHLVCHQMPERFLQVVYDLTCPADGCASAFDPPHAQPSDDLLHIAIPVVVGQRHRHVAFAVCLPELSSTSPTDRYLAMIAHADDASVRDGPVRDATQLIVPLCPRLPGASSLTLGLRPHDAIARPILGAAEQLLVLRRFVPNSRYRQCFSHVQRTFVLRTTSNYARCS